MCKKGARGVSSFCLLLFFSRGCCCGPSTVNAPVRGSSTPHPGPHPHTLLQVAVALAYALPSLSLSFGFSPSRGDLDAAAALVEPALGTLRPWEVALLLWGAARLDYHPGAGIMQVCVAVERWECAAGRL